MFVIALMVWVPKEIVAKVQASTIMTLKLTVWPGEACCGVAFATRVKVTVVPTKAESVVAT